MSYDVLNNEDIKKRVKKISSLTLVRGVTLLVSFFICLFYPIKMNDSSSPFIDYIKSAVLTFIADFELHEILFYIIIVAFVIVLLIFLYKAISLIIKGIKGLNNEEYQNKLLKGDRKKWSFSVRQSSPLAFSILYACFSLYLFHTFTKNMLTAVFIFFAIGLFDVVIEKIIKRHFKKIAKIEKTL